MLARSPRASSPTSTPRPSTPRPSSPTPGDFEQAKADVLKLVEWSCVPDAPKPDVAKTRAIPQLVKTLDATDPYQSVRYLRIEHSKQHIHVQQLQVYDHSGNKVTTAKTEVTSSSVVNDGNNSLMFDGNIMDTQAWPNSCHTDNGDKEWVLVDLGKEVSASRIIIYNRPDSEQGRLKNATLTCFNGANEIAVKLTLTGERKQCFGGLVSTSGMNLLHVIAKIPDPEIQKAEFVEAVKRTRVGSAAMVQHDNENGCTPLLFALQHGKDNFEFMESFLSLESVRIKGANKRTPLHLANQLACTISDEKKVEWFAFMNKLSQTDPDMKYQQNEENLFPHQEGPLGIHLGENFSELKGEDQTAFLMSAIDQYLAGDPGATSKTDSTEIMALHNAVLYAFRVPILTKLVTHENPIELLHPTKTYQRLPLHLALISPFEHCEIDLMEEQASFLLDMEKALGGRSQLLEPDVNGYLPVHLAFMRSFSSDLVRKLVTMTLEPGNSSTAHFFPEQPGRGDPNTHAGRTWRPLTSYVYLEEAYKDIPAMIPLLVHYGPDSDDEIQVMFPTFPVPVHPHDLVQQEKSNYWGCDGCGKSGNNLERYRCSGGCDFDYCGNCNRIAGTGKKVFQQSSTYIPLKLCHQYLAGGTLLHAVLNMDNIDESIFEDILEKTPEKAFAKKDVLGNRPIDIAIKRKRPYAIIKQLWDKLAQNQRRVKDAIKFGFFQAASDEYDLKKQNIVSYSLKELKDILVAAIEAAKRMDEKSSEKRNILEELEKSIIIDSPQVLQEVDEDFIFRGHLRQLAFAIDGERTIADILRLSSVPANRQPETAHDMVRKWSDCMTLEKIRGRETETTIEMGDIITCRRFSTWGCRGYLFKKGKIYYEVNAIEAGRNPQIGWATEDFESIDDYSNSGVGDCPHSFGADGIRKRLWGPRFFEKGSNASAAEEKISWKNDDIVGIAIDLDSTPKTFFVGINGEWVHKQELSDKNWPPFSGVWPAITHDGKYSVNLGGKPMQFCPPTNKFKTALEGMQHQTKIAEIIAFAKTPGRKLTPGACEIKAKDKLLFADGSSFQWKKDTIYDARLKPLKRHILPMYNSIKVGKDENGSLIVNDVSVKEVEPADFEIAIHGTAFHYVLAEGAEDMGNDTMNSIRDCFETVLNAKDGATRTVFDMAKNSDLTTDAKEILFDAMEQKKTDPKSFLRLMIQSQLWKSVETLLDENKDNKSLLNSQKGDDHAIHLAARNGAPKNIIEKILTIDSECILRKGRDNYNVLHCIIEGAQKFQEEEGDLKQKVNYIFEKTDTQLIIDTKEEESNGQSVRRNAEAEYGLLPLHLAAACRNKVLIDAILEKLPTPSMKEKALASVSKNDFTPLHWSVHTNEKFCPRQMLDDAELAIVEVLITAEALKKKIKLKLEKKEEKLTPFQLAIISNRTTNKILEKLQHDKSDDRRNILLAAQYATDDRLLDRFKVHILHQDTAKMTALHYAAKYNVEPKIVKKLIHMEKEREGEDKDGGGGKSNVRVTDKSGKLPIHYACKSPMCPLDTIKELFERHQDTDKGGHGGLDVDCLDVDVSQTMHLLPIHLATMSETRTTSAYSDIINYLFEKYKKSLEASKERDSPLSLILKEPKRIIKLQENTLKNMLEYFDEGTRKIPKKIDLSLYSVLNTPVFNKCQSVLCGIAEGNINKESLGKSLMCLYPRLFKMTRLNDRGIMLKFWFVMQTALFESIESIKMGKEIKGDLKVLTRTVVENCKRDSVLSKFTPMDTPMQNILDHAVTTAAQRNRLGRKCERSWLKKIVERIDPHDNDGVPQRRGGFPFLTTPLGYAVRAGCTSAIVALSEGGCSPVQPMFPANKKIDWNIESYDLANCAASTMKASVLTNWNPVLKAMRESPKTAEDRAKKAMKRLYTFRKLPLELITIFLMVFVGANTSTGFDSEQLRFGSHLSDKFVDEEFNPEDAHIKKTFFDIGTVEEFWQWVDGPLVGGLYPDTDKSKNGRNLIDDVSTIVGSIRVRQIRAKPSRCKNSIGVSSKILPAEGCTKDQVAHDGEFETKPFGPGNRYIYTKPSSRLYENVIVGDRYWGYRYPNGGYVIELPGGNRTKAIEILAQLKADEFVSVSSGTRLVIFDFSVYNYNVDRVASMRLMVEFWGGGGTHSNIDTTVLKFENPEDTLVFALSTYVLAAIFLIRGFLEIDEMAWGNLVSIAKQIEFGDPTLGDNLSTNLNFATLRVKGIDIGEYSQKYRWRPCCSNYRKVLPETVKTENTSTMKRKVRQVIVAAEAVEIMERGRESPESKFSSEDSPYTSDLSNSKSTCGNFIKFVVASVHVEIWVIYQNIILPGGIGLIRSVAKKQQNDTANEASVSDEITSPKSRIHSPGSPGKGLRRAASKIFRTVSGANQDDFDRDDTEDSETEGNAPSTTSILGPKNTYDGNVFSLWLQSMYRNDYFREWWNTYEWLLIILFAAYFFGEQTRESYNRETRLKIVSVLDSMSDEFVPLDNLSFYVTQTQDIVAIVFIFVCIHLLRVMQEIPYGIGARVMAILKVIPHKDVVPFYVTLIIMILSFAIGIHFAYANEIVEYRQLASSFLNIFFASFGDFGIGVDDMMDSAETITYLFVLLLILLVSLIMMNIFIGVVGNVYEQTEEESLKQFETDLDKYFIANLDEDRRRWAQKCLMPDFERSVQDEIQSENVDTDDY